MCTSSVQRESFKMFLLVHSTIIVEIHDISVFNSPPPYILIYINNSNVVLVYKDNSGYYQTYQIRYYIPSNSGTPGTYAIALKRCLMCLILVLKFSKVAKIPPQMHSDAFL